MQEIIKVLMRTIFFYFFVMFAYRIMGKREIGQLGVVDFVVSMQIAELISISIENIEDPIIMVIIPVVTLSILEILFARVSLKNKKFRTFFWGKPSTLISKGIIDFKEMTKQRYTLDDLLYELRQKSIRSLDKIDYAYLEPNGRLSIFEKNIFDKSFPMPLIIDGEIQPSSLIKIDKDDHWLNRVLHINELTTDDIFYAFYKNSKLYVIKYSDLKNS